MRQTCFVVMGFGKKTDFETGRTLDLDKTYRNIIKPAVQEAGLDCLRADEVVHSGLIDRPMYEYLLTADLVIADLSTANRNAFYELGVRHALKPYATIVIAEDGLKPPFPFDLNHLVIRTYRHLGEDIGYDEVMSFRAQLKEAIQQILPLKAIDSPVHEFLQPLSVQRGAAAASSFARGAAAAASAAGVGATEAGGSTHSELMSAADDAWAARDYATARSKLQQALDDMRRGSDGRQLTPDPWIVQRLALITYKSKDLPELDALHRARSLLEELEPSTSNDTETLGLWGAVHKRLWEETRDRSHLDHSIRAYERGFYLRNDYYNGINFAFLLNLRAREQREPGDAVADFVQARRVRTEVLAICDAWEAGNPPPDKSKVTADAMEKYLESEYWVLATRAEALLGIEDARADAAYEEANRLAVPQWMKDSTIEQRGKLEKLLADSPMRFLCS